MKKYRISTERQGYYDITLQVKEAIKESGVQSGICVVFVPHTTAGVTINENADPDVINDMILGYNNAFPNNTNYKHYEGNTTAHLKSSTVGASLSIIIDDGEALFGMWQGIYFVEFDGPRNRQYYIKIISE